jgi:hypothetical protein
MNLEASLKAWNEGADKYGMSQGYRDAFVNAIRALCSEPTPIKIEDLRIGMRVRTKDGEFTITALDCRSGPMWWYRGFGGEPVSDILEILP